MIKPSIKIFVFVLISSVFFGCFQTSQSVSKPGTKTRTASDPMHRKTILDKDTPYDLLQEKEKAAKEKGERNN